MGPDAHGHDRSCIGQSGEELLLMHPRLDAALAQAKARARRRRRGQGAALFIVAMVLAVLASVGAYALAAASTEMRTAGNERQNTQTHYLAEYGVLGTASELIATKAQFYLGLMLSNPDAGCVSLPGVQAANDIMLRACRRLPSAELGAAWAMNPAVDKFGGNTPYQSGVDPGSLGPTPLHGDFFVELTAPTMANAPPRYALDLHFCFIQLTASAVGVTQPNWVQDASQAALYGGEGLETQRARIVAGPVVCPH
jgi:hypothetical protein